MKWKETFHEVRISAMLEFFEYDFCHTAIRRSPRKNEKKPVYVLDISIEPQEVDNCLEPTKNAVELGVSPFVLSGHWT